MNQNLSSYWIFYTVANAGNISKAAKELYISQPAISKSIQKLEENLNCKLFSRSSRGVVLTEEGTMLYGHVKEAFATLSTGEDKLKRSIALGVGHLQIGVSATLCKYMLLPYLKEFIRRNPHISISISCQSTNETLRLLDENKIDIGLIGKPESMKGINFYYLDNIEDIFVANIHEEANVINRQAQMEEFMFLGLRMNEGVYRNEFEKCFGLPIEAVYRDQLEELKQEDLLEMREGRIYLTDKGMDLSNYAMAKFLMP